MRHRSPWRARRIRLDLADCRPGRALLAATERTSARRLVGTTEAARRPRSARRRTLAPAIRRRSPTRSRYSRLKCGGCARPRYQQLEPGAARGDARARRALRSAFVWPATHAVDLTNATRPRCAPGSIAAGAGSPGRRSQRLQAISSSAVRAPLRARRAHRHCGVTARPTASDGGGEPSTRRCTARDRDRPPTCVGHAAPRCSGHASLAALLRAPRRRDLLADQRCRRARRVRRLRTMAARRPSARMRPACVRRRGALAYARRASTR